MPAVIDATVGGASANSYGTQQEATTYFTEQSTSAAWGGATSDQQVRALITATRRIDESAFRGSKATTAQALQFPRCDVPDPDGSRGAFLGTISIPARLKRAQFKLAYEILAGTYGGGPTGLEPFARVVLGPLQVETRDGQNADALPDNVRREIQPYLLSGDGGVRLMKGG